MMSKVNSCLTRLMLHFVPKSVYSHIHLIVAMPGCGKSTCIASVRAQLHDVLEYQDEVRIFDTDDIRIKHNNPSLLRYLVDVVECAWSKHVVVFTNQWELAAYALNFGVDVRSFSLYTDDPDGVKCAHAHMDYRTPRCPMFCDATYKRWISSPRMKRFAAQLHDRLGSTAVYYICGEATYHSAARAVYRDVIAFVTHLLEKAGYAVPAHIAPDVLPDTTRPIRFFDEDALSSIPGRDC